MISLSIVLRLARGTITSSTSTIIVITITIIVVVIIYTTCAVAMTSHRSIRSSAGVHWRVSGITANITITDNLV